jgi:hypothetical protein
MFRPILMCAAMVLLGACAADVGRTGPGAADVPAGATTNAPRAIQVSAVGANAAEPAVASAADGGAYVVWVEHGANKRSDVLFRAFDPAGTPIGDSIRVNPDPGTAKTWSGDPPTISTGPDGTIYIGWTASPKGGGGTDLYLSVSRDRGQTFDMPVKVNDDTAPASHGMHSLAVDASGRIYFAWLDERYLTGRTHADPQQHRASQAAEPNAELYMAVSTDGGRSFSPNRRIAGDACPCCKTSIAIADDHRVHIGWRHVLPGDFRHIAISTSADGGETFSPPVVVSDDRWQIYACPVSGPSLLRDGDALEVAWFAGGDARPHGLYRSRSNDGGRTFSPAVPVSPAVDPGSPVFVGNEMVWSDNGKLWTKSIDVESAQNERSGDDRSELGIGRVPAAAAGSTAGRLFVAFTRSENQRGDVWLLVVSIPDRHRRP